MGKTAKKRREKRGRDLAKELEKRTEKEKAELEVSKLKDEELFEITDKSKGIKKRYPLDPARFKKKMWKFLGKSKNESRMVEKMKKKMLASGNAGEKEKVKKKEPELMDLWETKGPEPRRAAQPFKSYLPAVALPHAGQSYNPAAADYKELLQRAVEFENLKEQQDKKALETLQQKRTVKTEGESKVENVQAAEEDSDKEIPSGDINKISLNKPVDDTKRKTTTQRNRERKSQKVRHLEEAQKIEKKKLHDINHIKEIVKGIKEEASLKAKLVKQKQEKQEVKLKEQQEGVVFGRRRIGRYKYEQLAVDFMLPEDLPKKLNDIKVDDASNIRNCYESILRRGLVQPAAEGRIRGKSKAKHKYRFTDVKDDNDKEDKE